MKQAHTFELMKALALHLRKSDKYVSGKSKQPVRDPEADDDMTTLKEVTGETKSDERVVLVSAPSYTEKTKK